MKEIINSQREEQAPGIVNQTKEPHSEVNLLKKEKIEMQNRIKILSNYISIISHDLKGPLASIVTLTSYTLESIKEDGLDEKDIIEQYKVINETCNRLLNLFNDLLTLMMLQKDNIDPDIFEFQLKDRVNDQLTILASSADLKNISLINKIEEDVKVMANDNMLNTIIRNLVSNAIKFTKEGGEISISSYTENDQTSIAVKDNGVGLESDILNNIFNNGGETTPGTNGEKGTGFGLQICKEMINKMGGKIEAQSEGLDMGTTFIIKLPSA